MKIQDIKQMAADHTDMDKGDSLDAFFRMMEKIVKIDIPPEEMRPLICAGVMARLLDIDDISPNSIAVYILNCLMIAVAAETVRDTINATHPELSREEQGIMEDNALDHCRFYAGSEFPSDDLTARWDALSWEDRTID